MTTSRREPGPRSSSPSRLELPHGTLELARSLIGARLQSRIGGRPCAGIIVETEAYPPGDPASHAYRGPTPRNRSMYRAPGTAYVYLIYGTSWCLNVTSEAEGAGAAVLIRALEPLEGIEIMRERRPGIRDRDLARGPGRLCSALGVTREHDGLDLLDSSGPLWIERGDPSPPDVGCSVRIGLTRAAEAPLRYYLRGSGWLSGPVRLSP